MGHIKDVSSAELEFRLHVQPDFDCASTLYCAFELKHNSPRKEILQKLAHYTGLIDQGSVPDFDRLSDSFLKAGLY